MALSHSPAVVTNGLVYYHDMGNTQKSWKGAPAVNLFGTNLSATNFQKTLSGITYNGYRAVGVGNDNPRNTLFNGSLAVAASTFYTLSCLYWSSNNIVDDVYLYFTDAGWPESTNYIQPFGTQSVTRNGSFNITDLGGGWKYCVGTFQTLATTTTLGQIFYDVDTAGVEVFIANIQLEQNTFATPFTSSTRTTSNNIVDLTGTNTVTANSLIYASNNTFSFNGSSTYASIPENSVFNTQTPTVEVWIKTNATTQNGFFFEKGTVNSQYALFQEGANLTWRQFLSGSLASLTAPAATYINTSQYAQVVGTFTTGDRRMYVNGVQVASDAAAGTFTTNANGCSIGVYGGFTGVGGRGYYFNGNIGIVKVYNRVLSAAEVLQNFNALRGRYGL